jgi:hypothetical protein
MGPGPDGRRMRAVRTVVVGEERGRRGPARAVQLCNVGCGMRRYMHAGGVHETARGGGGGGGGEVLLGGG